MSGKRLKPRPGRLVIRVGDEDAVRLGLAPTNAAAQLVELGKAEAVGVEDEHDRGLWHVNANLQNSRAHKHIQLPAPKAVHSGVALSRLHLAMNHTDTRRW